VIAQNQNHFRNQRAEIIQKLSILCKHQNQCRPVLFKVKTSKSPHAILDINEERRKCSFGNKTELSIILRTT
jgi:hypothetical protein